MKVYNVIVIYNKEGNKTLMCLRKKNPYKGLYNFVGGKKEENEDSITAAYRELFEETGISKDDVTLTHVMDGIYFLNYQYTLEVYFAKLDHDVELVEELNKLYWIDLDSDFTDVSKYAGDGNIDHIIRIINKSLI